LGGLIYGDSTDEALGDAIEQWDRHERQLEPPALQAYAAKFSRAEFSAKMKPVLLGPSAPANVADL
jgi:hypothetical protein